MLFVNERQRRAVPRLAAETDRECIEQIIAVVSTDRFAARRCVRASQGRSKARGTPRSFELQDKFCSRLQQRCNGLAGAIRIARLVSGAGQGFENELRIRPAGAQDGLPASQSGMRVHAAARARWRVRSHVSPRARGERGN